MSQFGDPRPFTLRRSCQACSRGKRRCDQRLPQCTRCMNRGVRCEYINAPMVVKHQPGVSAKPKTTRQSQYAPFHQIETSLRLEITKEFQASVIQFLVNSMQAFPATFITDRKTLFIHPDGYWHSMPGAVKNAFELCNIYVKSKFREKTDGVYIEVASLLREKSASFFFHFNHASTFDELLGCAQSLILMQCILVLQENDHEKYANNVSDALEGIAIRLWQQAPIQLPSMMNPRRAWLLAESVRRTIIIALVLRSAYSLNKRKRSARTPFVEALPFDLRTHLWDADPEEDWEPEASLSSTENMISLYEYSGALESGRFHQPSHFGALILAACKGKHLSTVQFPPQGSYLDT